LWWSTSGEDSADGYSNLIIDVGYAEKPTDWTKLSIMLCVGKSYCSQEIITKTFDSNDPYLYEDIIGDDVSVEANGYKVELAGGTRVTSNGLHATYMKVSVNDDIISFPSDMDVELSQPAIIYKLVGDNWVQLAQFSVIADGMVVS